jgi:predicted DNA-binding transcriptional regulator YafY
MRAARLLRLLLLLQNRGRLTAARLAEELEVSRRTILRDIDALTEAGLPVVTLPGAGGGIILAFDYRTRLTGLDGDEARALGLILSRPSPELTDLGLAEAAASAATKLWEALPDQTRSRMTEARACFPATERRGAVPDPRRLALSRAVAERRIVRLATEGVSPTTVHPSALQTGPGDWVLIDARDGTRHPEHAWGRINISARQFAD